MRKKTDEIAYRRLAFRFFDKGKSTKQILQKIPRSRPWLFKWKRRFRERGWQALDSFSKTPHSSPQAYDRSVRDLVLRVRHRLERAKVGLVGARAVFLELRRKRLVKAVPSVSTIKRWLREAGLFQNNLPKTEEAYYPAPQFLDAITYLSMDWMARYLEGGEKVFCFHTLDHLTHALWQTISRAKTTDVAYHHLLQSASELGLADFLQVDNDAAFTGLGRNARMFGRFMRLALYLGIELIFIPPGEPKRNSLVERVNGLWAANFFDKDHFASMGDLKRKRGKFLRWYDSYAPPALAGLSVKEARGKVRRRTLSAREVESLPEELPLTEGRVHFIRRVSEQGCIEILKESFRVSKRLAGQYVWATIELPQKKLSIYHRRSQRATAKMVKRHPYQIEEKIEKLRPQFRRPRRRVGVVQII